MATTHFDYAVSGSLNTTYNVTAGKWYIVTAGTGITTATLTSSLGAEIYTFTGAEARKVYMTAGATAITASGTGTLRIEKAN